MIGLSRDYTCMMLYCQIETLPRCAVILTDNVTNDIVKTLFSMNLSSNCEFAAPKIQLITAWNFKVAIPAVENRPIITRLNIVIDNTVGNLSIVLQVTLEPQACY